jgi:hypothetical protein
MSGKREKEDNRAAAAGEFAGKKRRGVDYNVVDPFLNSVKKLKMWRRAT